MEAPLTRKQKREAHEVSVRARLVPDVAMDLCAFANGECDCRRKKRRACAAAERVAMEIVARVRAA